MTEGVTDGTLDQLGDGASIGALALLVRDYDEAIAYYCGVLGFRMLEDTRLSESKRWVRVAPRGGGVALLLARATTPEQQECIGRQAGGRVFLFLDTDDFARDHREMTARGVRFVEAPRHEEYGWVAVFEDLYGNRWDMVERRRNLIAIAPRVVAVSRSATHTMSKPNASSIELIAGHGVRDDAHAGVTVKHRSRVARDPSQPNLRQVHLIHAELHDRLDAHGFRIPPGQMGENVTTRGIDLLSLSRGARLRLGATAVVEVTGLRNPCAQLDGIQPGLMEAVLDRDGEGRLIRLAGVMAIVLEGGEVRAGDEIQVVSGSTGHLPLEPV